MSPIGTLSTTEQAMLSALCDTRLQELLALQELTIGQSEESRLLYELSVKLSTHVPATRTPDIVVINAQDISTGWVNSDQEEKLTPLQLVTKLSAKVAKQAYVGAVSIHAESDFAEIVIHPNDSNTSISVKMFIIEVEQKQTGQFTMYIGDKVYNQAEFYTYMQEDLFKDLERELNEK